MLARGGGRVLRAGEIAEMNDYQSKVAKLRGDFIWHDHKDTDETFIVIECDLRIDFRRGGALSRADGSSPRAGRRPARSPGRWSRIRGRTPRPARRAPGFGNRPRDPSIVRRSCARDRPWCRLRL